MNERIQEVLNYASYEPLRLDPRIIRYKDFTFSVGPTSCEVSQESRLAEYKYLFTDGIEYSKVKGATKITLSGIAIPNGLKRLSNFDSGATESRGTFTERFYNDEVGRFEQTAAAYFYDKFRAIDNGVAGVLVTPGLGTFSNTLLTSYTFTENGDNPRQLDYRLEFLVGTVIKPVSVIVPELNNKEAPVDQQNVEYTIKSGDTLSGIANKYGVSLSLLRQLNPGLFDARHRNGNLIFPGEKVIIKKTTAGTETPTAFTDTNKTPVSIFKTIPWDSQLGVMVANKGNPIGLTGMLIDGVRHTTYELFTTLNSLSKTRATLPAPVYVNSVDKDSYVRPKSTLDKYLESKGQEVDSKVAEPFPVFAGLINYKEKSSVNSSIVVKQ